MSWCSDFSECKTSFTSKDRLTPGHKELSSLNHPSFRPFITRAVKRDVLSSVNAVFNAAVIRKIQWLKQGPANTLCVLKLESKTCYKKCHSSTTCVWTWTIAIGRKADITNKKRMHIFLLQTFATCNFTQLFLSLHHQRVRANFPLSHLQAVARNRRIGK